MATGSRNVQPSDSRRAGRRDGRPNSRPDQSGWRSAGEHSVGYAELQDASRDGGHRDDSPSARGACALVNGNDDTTVKSIDLEEALNDAPPLSREPSSDGSNINNSNYADVHEDDRVYNYPAAETALPLQMSALAIEERRLVPAASIGDTALDISLHSRQANAALYSENITSGSGSSSTSTSANSVISNQAVSVNGRNIQMNILPDEGRVNNTEVPVGMGELALYSHRTTSTVNSSLPPISPSVAQQTPPQSQQGQFQLMPQEQRLQPRHSYSTALFHIAPSRHTSAPYVSNEDNTQNISVSILPNGRLMTAQPLQETPNTAAGAQRNHGRNSGPAEAGGAGRPLSHSNSMSSMRSFIQDSCLVRRLPRRILKLVADHLHCRCGSGTWKELVEMYDWNYNKTFLFENQNHQEGPFFSLLREPEFQDYTLEQLRNDLFELPRRDVLSELNEMITDHNSNASSRPGDGNGNPMR